MRLLRKLNAEAVIRVGADGAEWLAWNTRGNDVDSGRMTASYGIEAALDQWLSRAGRAGYKIKRIWLVAGAAECAHRQVTLPGTESKVIQQALPLALEDELPLPISEMWWCWESVFSADGKNSVVDVIASPARLYRNWEEAIRTRKIELAGCIPEAPLLWRELAAIRGAEIDLLAVWGDRRTSILRGDESKLSHVYALIRGSGESWEELLPQLRRPFQSHNPNRLVVSYFTNDRLRKRAIGLPDLYHGPTENHTINEVFQGLPENFGSPVSLLTLRRLRMENREPEVLLTTSDSSRRSAEIRKAARKLEVPIQLVWVSLLVIILLSVWITGIRINRRYADDFKDSLALLRTQQEILDDQSNALRDLAKVYADWGSVFLELSEKIPPKTLFNDFSCNVGSDIRITGQTPDQPGLDKLVEILAETGYFNKIRVLKTEKENNKLTFQIMAEFDSSKVDWYQTGQIISDATGEVGKPTEPDSRQARKRRADQKPSRRKS